jgi:hypothetical protein
MQVNAGLDFEEVRLEERMRLIVAGGRGVAYG